VEFYNPVTDTWANMNLVSALFLSFGTPRSGPEREMLFGVGIALGTIPGRRTLYHFRFLVHIRWIGRSLSPLVSNHDWTGTEMIVWGAAQHFLSDGGPVQPRDETAGPGDFRWSTLGRSEPQRGLDRNRNDRLGRTWSHHARGRARFNQRASWTSYRSVPPPYASHTDRLSGPGRKC